MATVKEVYMALDELAPFRLQQEYDNSGFLAGHGGREVHRILVALDITAQVAAEAAELGAELIVSHHPLIFQPLRQVTDGDETGRLLLNLLEGGIAAVCAHTNLDAVQAGVSCCLATALGLTQVGQLCQEGVDDRGVPYGIGRVGRPHQAGLSPRQYAEFVRRVLGAKSLRFVDGGKPVEKVAVGGGSCGSLLENALREGCDTFVTADVKYDVFLRAKALGITLMDAGHFPTEQVVCRPLTDWLSARFPGLTVTVSQVHREVYEALEGREVEP